MKLWDLAGGAAKLEQAMESLEKATNEVAGSWQDETQRQFAERYVESVAPRVKSFLDALHRLGEVLSTAERQCRDQ